MGEASSGHKQWMDWFFDYGVFGTEGLCLLDGYFRGQKMFNKLSLPVIRVKYVQDESWGGATSLIGTGCGPYNDQITWDPEDFGENLNPISGPHHLVKIQCPGGDRYICTEEISIGGVPHFRLAVYARIGAYHIVQDWVLDNDGWIRPRIFSKGLSCDLDHWHHPYWRFDFALGSPESQRVAVFHQGGGPKIADIYKEGRLINSNFSRRPEYHVTSTKNPVMGVIRSPAKVVIIPPVPNDSGIVGPTPFSSLDGYVRIFRSSEDRPWPHAPADDIEFSLHQSCVDSDIVFWSVGHLFHRASEGKDHFHSVGPNLLFKPMVIAAYPEESRRLIKVSGKMSVKDFGVVEDEWKHEPFSGHMLLNPDTLHGEIVAKSQVGDVTAELVIRGTWNPDFSVTIKFTARLFDELQRVAEASKEFNVLRDASMSWGGIHVVDYHKGDPDSADISFDVVNSQQP